MFPSVKKKKGGMYIHVLMNAYTVNLLFLWLYFKSLSVGVYNGNTDRPITRAALAGMTTITI